MKETLDGKRLLLQFKHGWGDCLQFGIVLKHLKHYFPDWEISVEAKHGKHRFFEGLCAGAYPLHHPMNHRDKYKQRPRQVLFSQPDDFYDKAMFPVTKAATCLFDEFQISPIEDLFYYEFVGSTEFEYPKPYSVLHCDGASGQEDKNLTDEEANAIVHNILNEGQNCILFDWEGVLLFEEGEEDKGCELWNKFNHPEMADPAFVYRVLSNAQAVYGIDSGIAHLAGATETPTYCFWTNHNPWSCFDLAANVFHYLPDQSMPPYFKTHYNHGTYQDLLAGIEAKDYLKIPICPHYIED